MSIIIDGTNGISDIDGSASTPAIRGTDANTGIFFPAADTIAFAEGGAEAMRIDSSGNLNIGTTGYGTYFSSNKNISLGEGATIRASASGGDPYITISSNAYFTNTPDWKYVVTDFASSYEQYNGAHVWSSAASGTAGNAITFTERMRIDSSGNVGIGTSSPTFVTGGGLQISNATQANLRLSDTTNSGYNFDLFMNDTDAYVVNRANGPTIFFTNNTERARITSGGNFLIGKTSTSGTVVGGNLEGNGYSAYAMSASANSTTTFDLYSTGASAYRFYVGLGGTIYATSTTISAISDQRLKENIQDIDVGLDAVMALKPRKFDWKEGKGKDKKGDRGWIAQEFEQVFPEMIDVWKDPAPEGEEPYKSVNADLIPVLVKAIQELKAITDAQATRIEALEAEVAALKAKE